MVADARNKRQNFFIILLLGFLNTITPITIDMYLPAFPKIAKDLHTTIQNVSLTVSTYFLGFALGQILYGPLLDRYGRKKPLYIGLVLYVAASLICTTASTINALLVIRFFQALSGCVAAVAAMAMVRDFFPPEKSASIISLLILILGISPLLAPTIGSFIISIFNWRCIFIILTVAAFIVLALVFFFLPQGAPPDENVSLKPSTIIATFKSILFLPQFYIFSLSGTFSFAGLFVYVAGSPAVFMDGFHVSAKVYGGIFALLSVGFVGSSQMNHFLTRHYKNETILRATSVIQTITGALFFAGVMAGLLNITSTIIFLFIILGCAGLTYPNAAAIALEPFEKNAGSAAALLGFIQIGVGGLVSSAIGFLHAKGSFPVAMIICITSAIGLLILFSQKIKFNLSAKSG